MAIRPIRSEADHDVAIARIEALWDAQSGTPEHDEIEVLSVLVSAYEEERWPILPPDPIDAIKFHMEQNGLKQKDLASIKSEWRLTPTKRRTRLLT
jgi:HTH-type transcriptional regulator/antitoxin HigA